MTPEQFTYWLKGFLAGSPTLSEADQLALIKSTAQTIIQPHTFTVGQPSTAYFNYGGTTTGL